MKRTYDIRTFGDITDGVLKACYHADRTLFWRVVNQLAFFGVGFQSQALRPFTVVADPKNASYLLYPAGDRNKPLDISVDVPARNQLTEYGIHTVGCLVGVPTESVRRLQGGDTMMDYLGSIGFTIGGLAQLECTINEEQNYPHEQHSDNSLMVQENGADAAYDVPVELLRRELSAAEWPECTPVILALRQHGVKRIGQLPENLESFLLGLGQVGPAMVEAFTRRLKSLVASTNSRINSATVVLDLVHDDFVGGRLTHEQIPERLGSIWLKDVQKFQEMVQYLDTDARRTAFPTLVDNALSLVLSRKRGPELGADESVMNAVRILPRQWVQDMHTISAYILESPEQRLVCDLRPFWETIKQLAAGEQPNGVKKSSWNLFNRKIDSWLAGDYPTLQEMGGWLGLTRERARQIDKKIDVVVQAHADSVQALTHFLRTHGGFVDAAIILPGALTPRERTIAIDLLERVDVTLDDQLQLVTVVPLEPVVKRTVQALSQELTPIFTTAQLEAAVADYVIDKRFHSSAAPALTRILLAECCTQFGDRWTWPGVSKMELAVSVFKQYTEGFPLYQDVAEFRARLDELVPALFDTDRAIIASVTNSPDVLLWGWGVYIHRDHIHVDRAIVNSVAVWIQAQLQLGLPQLMSNAAFSEFEDDLMKAGVPNEHALYTCLRLFHPEEFFLPKAPKIFPKGEHRSYTNAEILEPFLEDGPKTLDELRQEFGNRLGWKEPTLLQVLSSSNQIIRCGADEFGLLSQFAIRFGELEPLAQYLELKLGQGIDTVSVGAVLKDREAYCYKLGIKNAQLLYSLLQIHFSGRFSFHRYPHVARPRSLSRQDVSHRKLVASYLLERQDVVTKEELRHEFLERRGWLERSLDNGLHSADILPYTRGAVAEYVHRSVIGWDEAKSRALLTYVEEKLEELRDHSFPFGLVRGMLDRKRLPQLDNCIPWTEDVLQGLMEEMDSVLMLGTKRSLFAPLPNRLGIEDNGDFISYILKQEFGGATKRSVLESRLLKLDFCRVIPEALITAPDLPYCAVADEIVLKEW